MALNADAGQVRAAAVGQKSILVLLLWVYYSGLIFYFGAEFTKTYADRYGSRKRDKRPKTTGKHLAAAHGRKSFG